MREFRKHITKFQLTGYTLQSVMNTIESDTFEGLDYEPNHYILVGPIYMFFLGAYARGSGANARGQAPLVLIGTCRPALTIFL